MPIDPAEFKKSSCEGSLTIQPTSIITQVLQNKYGNSIKFADLSQSTQYTLRAIFRRYSAEMIFNLLPNTFGDEECTMLLYSLRYGLN